LNNYFQNFKILKKMSDQNDFADKGGEALNLDDGENFSDD